MRVDKKQHDTLYPFYTFLTYHGLFSLSAVPTAFSRGLCVVPSLLKQMTIDINNPQIIPLYYSTGDKCQNNEVFTVGYFSKLPNVQ